MGRWGGGLLISEILIHGKIYILELKKCSIMMQCEYITIKLKMKVLLIVNHQHHLSNQRAAPFYFHFNVMLIDNTFACPNIKQI